jgi:hypothetical protein
MKTAYKRGGDRLMSVWERDLNAIEAAIMILDKAARPPAAPVEPYIYGGDGRSDAVETDADLPTCQDVRGILPRSSAATEQEITSIVSRLRNFAIWNNRQSHYEPVPLCKEAADLIERIRAVPQEALKPSASAVEHEMADSAEYLKQSSGKPTGVTVEGLADWFYDHGWEFVVADDEEVVRDLLKHFDIRPKGSELSRPQGNTP